eukprot:TRINITY_DN732_c0_g2_i1.p1 TRINITY_DN732_c0_g2~~TRINITY_DN732_c0_g2_i1.p1  ORF type:complete len:719 (+),score=108.41 TRINITY_DN732_c0_g2_i1:106-2262(+)
MKGLISFILFTSLVALSQGQCDYNITSFNDLKTAFTQQTGWTTIPTLCFAPGLYTPTQPLLITKSQKWVGAQAGIDAACGRVVSPPCNRLVTASNANATVESILTSPSYSVVKVTTAGINVTLWLDGFVISNPTASFSYLVETVASLFTLNLNNTYISNNFFSVDAASVDRCYATGSNLISSSMSNSVTNSYFKRASLGASSGSLYARDNTFVQSGTALQASQSLYAENNMFLYSNQYAIYDLTPASFIKKNLFWSYYIGYQTYGSSVISPTLEQNCFIDNINDAVELDHNILNTTTVVFNQNYFGSKMGPTLRIANLPGGKSYGGSFFPPTIHSQGNFVYNFPFSPLPLSNYEAPNVCPRGSPFSIEMTPNQINIEEQVTITLSATLDPLLVSAGIDLSYYDGMTYQVLFYAPPGNMGSAGAALPFSNPAFSWNPSVNPTISFNYTFTKADFPASVLTSQSTTFNLFLRGYTGPTTFSNLYNGIKPMVWKNVTIHIKPPHHCYNLTYTIDKGLQSSNPQHLNFTTLGCSNPDWKILSVNSSSIYSYSSNAITMNIKPNLSGVRPVHFQIGYGSNIYVHNVVAQIVIVNHAPVINNAAFTWTYPRTQQTFPSWNLVSACTDQDGDTMTIVQIQPPKGSSPSNIIQLDALTLYYVSEKAVLSVQPTGEISLTAPKLTTPVTAGSPLALFWNKSLSFQFLVTDGDVLNANTWGIATIKSV